MLRGTVAHRCGLAWTRLQAYKRALALARGAPFAARLMLRKSAAAKSEGSKDSIFLSMLHFVANIQNNKNNREPKKTVATSIFDTVD